MLDAWVFVRKRLFRYGVDQMPCRLLTYRAVANGLAVVKSRRRTAKEAVECVLRVGVLGQLNILTGTITLRLDDGKLLVVKRDEVL